MIENIFTKKLAFVDIETTGLDYDKHEIIEIACIVAICKKVNGKYKLKKLDEFECKVMPEHLENADETALKINKFSVEKWGNSLDQEVALKKLAEISSDCIMVAHNIVFDYSFIDRAFRRVGIENKMNYHGLDTISIAYGKLINDKKVDKITLHNLTKYFKIKNENEHSALADTKAMLELFEKLVNM